ncbi:MAG TPA: hypothetical protein VNT75_32275, partial [Symbiobacteriaceae bacterium]|nr:hypothetical protein [Symbiobacteriaceae bacterium]
CRALAAEPGAPDLPERLRAHLRVSRMAEVIRALELEGLMRLDPVVSPATHVYFVGDAAEIPKVAGLIDEAAAELKAKVVKVAIIDGPLTTTPPFPHYLLEPITAHGLVLDEAEYRAAAVELLVAAAQPGGSQILAGGRGMGTLGIAWLTWSPGALEGAWAGRLSREVLARCVGAAAPPGRAPDLAAGREGAVLAHLPFFPGPDGDIKSEGPLWGAPTPKRLKRAAIVLDRRIQRWTRRIHTHAAARLQQETALLDSGAHEALTSGADGLARLRTMYDAAIRDASRRLDQAPPRRPAAGVGAPIRPLLGRLDAAQALPDHKIAAIALGAGLLLFTLIWWLTGGKVLSWLGGTAFQLLAFGGYLAYRPWRINKSLQALNDAMTRRAEAAVHAAYHDALARLDEAIEHRGTALKAQIDALPSQLNLQPKGETAQTNKGALCFPLVEPEAAEPLYRDLQQQVPDLAARLATGGVLFHWQNPAELTRAAEAEIRTALAEKPQFGPAQAATRAYGDRLALRLRDLVERLYEWSQPLLARPGRLPEGRRWLLWPEGLPCPPVPPEVTVLPYAQSCIAIVHVIAGLPATGERKSEETA